jgi:hypothetical protein
MSNYLAIATVTAALSRALQAALGADVPGALVTTVRPDGPSSGVPETGANLFLYQVTPNSSWRNNDLPTRRPDGTLVQRPQVAIDLHYLLSFYGVEADLEPQRLLGSTIRTLHAKPVLTRQEIQNTVNTISFLNDSDLAEEVESVKFTPIPLNLEELSKLWSVFFQTPYVLSVAYEASVVLISTEQRPVMAQPVREPVIRVRPSVALEGVLAAEPDTFADLQLWLRADADVTHDSLGFVSQWADQSGNDNHALQTVDARKPSFARGVLNGKPVMRFDGVDDYFAIDKVHYDTPGQISGMTIFALVKSSSSTDQILASFDRNEYWRFSLRSGAAGGVGWHTRPALGSVHDLLTSQAYTDGNWHVIACRFEAGASPDKQIFVDGEAVASADAHGGENLGSGVTRFGFVGVGSEADAVNGTTGPAQFLAGDLAEVLIYNRALSDTERQQIEQYFIEKYTSS